MLRLAIIVPLLCAAGATGAAPWTYRGTLQDGGHPAHGRYDLRLSLRHAGKAYVAPLTLRDIEVREGAFAVDIDLPFDPEYAPRLMLETEVAPAGGVFEPLGAPVAFDAKSALAGVCWDTGGNAGTNPAADFLGTTDAQPLVLRTRNAQSLRLEPSSIVASGIPNTANVIGGSSTNAVSAGVRGAAIGGGGSPSGNSDPDFVNENPNRVTDHYGTVSGGMGNQAGDNDLVLTTAPFATVGGGQSNFASAEAATVAGGFANSASGVTSAVVGGNFNRATGSGSAALGGSLNTAAGAASTVSGATNCAGGDRSWAGGYSALVRYGNGVEIGSGGGCVGVTAVSNPRGDEGTFYWGDSSTAGLFESSGPNQFLVRAGGGMGLNTAPIPSAEIELSVETSATAGLDYANFWLKQRSASNNGVLLSVGDGSGSNNAGFYIDQFNGTSQARRLELAPSGAVTIRSNVSQANTGVTMAANGGSWTSLSDRRLKTAIEAVDPEAILERVVALPISTWSYIAQGTDVRHIGPMAQDFKAAFAVGESDTGITTIDADGVALAAIQGLNRKLEAENAELRARLAALEARTEAPR